MEPDDTPVMEITGIISAGDVSRRLLSLSMNIVMNRNGLPLAISVRDVHIRSLRNSFSARRVLTMYSLAT